jgi:hypothetical protein
VFDDKYSAFEDGKYERLLTTSHEMSEGLNFEDESQRTNIQLLRR